MSEPIQSRNPIRLSLGPIQFFWQKETLLEFYVSMLDAPVDTIYLGEVVCSRRQKMRFADWYGLAENLADSGKEIILSSQVLLESETDLRRLHKITNFFSTFAFSPPHKPLSVVIRIKPARRISRRSLNNLIPWSSCVCAK